MTLYTIKITLSSTEFVTKNNVSVSVANNTVTLKDNNSNWKLSWKYLDSWKESKKLFQPIKQTRIQTKDLSQEVIKKLYEIYANAIYSEQRQAEYQKLGFEGDLLILSITESTIEATLTYDNLVKSNHYLEIFENNSNDYTIPLTIS